MSNFGVRKLRVVAPYDVAFREARSAVGAAEILVNAVEYADLATAIADCNLVVGTTAIGHRELQHPLWPLPEAAPKIRAAILANADEASCVALVFGSEKFGLSKESLSHCHWLLHIPTREENYSMNLGQAVAVCLYELARDAMPEPASEKMQEFGSAQPANSEELERMTQVLFELLQASNSARAPANDNLEENLRRLILRLHPSGRDVEILLGMLRRVLWKVRNP